MTTRTQTIDTLLRERRGDRPKAPIYRLLGVSASTYDSWEAGMYTPTAKYGPALAEYLEMEEQEVAWVLYISERGTDGRAFSEDQFRDSVLFDFIDEKGDLFIDLDELEEDEREPTAA